MEFKANKKTYWIALGEINKAGILTEGQKIEFNGEIKTYFDELKWKIAKKEFNVTVEYPEIKNPFK